MLVFSVISVILRVRGLSCGDIGMGNGVRIAIGCDHAGFDLKTQLIDWLRDHAYEVMDLGAHGIESVDYPDYADLVARHVLSGKAEFGLLICGTGIGISIAANRHKGVRAALVSNATMARLTRQHNNANVLALGARITGYEVARDALEVFLTTPYEGGRHERRVAKLG